MQSFPSPLFLFMLITSAVRRYASSCWCLNTDDATLVSLRQISLQFDSSLRFQQQHATEKIHSATYWRHEVVTDGFVFCVVCMVSCQMTAWLLLSLLWLLLDNEPLALSCCQSGRQTGRRPGHRRLMPSASALRQGHANGRTQGKVIRTLAHWLGEYLTDWLNNWLGFLVFCKIRIGQVKCDFCCNPC